MNGYLNNYELHYMSKKTQGDQFSKQQSKGDILVDDTVKTTPPSSSWLHSILAVEGGKRGEDTDQSDICTGTKVTLTSANVLRLSFMIRFSLNGTF